MTLQLIGAGWGRTGTNSTKTALDQLGMTSHHMMEVFSHLEQAQLFLEAADDPAFDWERIYAPYLATVDFPGCVFWRELAAYYPDAKVLLNVRDAARWFDSFRATIYNPLTKGWDEDPDGSWNRMVQRVIVDRALEGEPHDRDRVIAAFERHNAEVIASFPTDRLLVYDVVEGWPSLCAFLGKPVPSEPFPHTNDRASWAQRGR